MTGFSARSDSIFASGEFCLLGSAARIVRVDAEKTKPATITRQQTETTDHSTTFFQEYESGISIS